MREHILHYAILYTMHFNKTIQILRNIFIYLLKEKRTYKILADLLHVQSLSKQKTCFCMELYLVSFPVSTKRRKNK